MDLAADLARREDPALPGLATATDRRALAAVLRSFGVGGVGEDGACLRVHLRAHRPRRRAVIEVVGPTSRHFVKVVRPSAVQSLNERHRMLAAAGLPTPRSLGWTEDGLVVLEPLHGTPMRAALRDPMARLPTPADLVALLDRLPEAVVALPHRPSWADGAEHYGRLVGVALPAEAARAAQLAEQVGRLSSVEAGAEPVHGDFYEGQLLITVGRITGLLDVDTVGPGRRADDLACLIGHVAVLGTLRREHRARLAALASAWFEELAFRGGRPRTGPFSLARPLDPVDLAARVAGVVLSLATGPRRVQEKDWEASTRRRLDVVEHWVGRAQGLS